MGYLDHAAATALRPEARAAWIEASHLVGNASSLHESGRAVRRLIEESRERIGSSLGVAPSGIVFTSGGTESDNVGITGCFRARRNANSRRTVVVHSAVEHKAVLEPIAALAEEGARTLVLSVDSTGCVDPGELRELLSARGAQVALVAVMWANNEVGAVQPIADIADVCAEFQVPLHCDAVQAVGNLPVDLSLATTSALSGHKVGGPFGVGVLVVRNHQDVQPLMFGGGQEYGLRAGTLNMPGIVAVGVALTQSLSLQTWHAHRVGVLRDQLVAGVLDAIPDAKVNSTSAGLPGLANISFPGCEGDALMMLLDAAGVQVSTGSACTVGITQPSHVLIAMGASTLESRSALRFSLGWNSSESDVAATLAALPDTVSRARRAAQVARTVTTVGAVTT